MRNRTKLKTLYFFTFSALGVMNPLISQYLNSIGFSGTQIGTITSVSTAVAIGASTFWGHRYANSKDGRKVVIFLCVAAALTGVLNSFVMSFVLFVLTYGLMFFFQGPVNGTTDSMVLENHEEFAGIRLWGAVGYALAVFAGGRIGEAFGLDKIFYIYAGAYLIAALIVMTVSAKPHHEMSDGVKKPDTEKVGFGELFTDKKAVQLILCGIFICGSNVANNTYFSFLYLDGGGSVSGVGTTFLLMVGCEAPFMALAPWLSKKITREKSIAFAALLSALRFGWYATGPSWQLLMGTFFLQGIVNGIILVEYVKYISAIVRPRLIGIAVAAYYAISSHIGTILCNFFGGIVMDYYGSVGVYALFSFFNLVGVILYVIFGLHKHIDSKYEKCEKDT